jgi:hypothetical protein
MNKLKISFVTLMYISILSTTAFAESPKSGSGDVGRYQLFLGEYSFINIKGEQHWIKALFKVDTKTGEMFTCGGSQFDGKLVGKSGQIVQRQKCTKFEDEISWPKNEVDGSK